MSAAHPIDLRDPAILDALDVAYARLNSARTVADSLESTLEARRFGGLSALREPARATRPTFNRVLSVAGDEDVVALLDALAWFQEAGVQPRVDVDDPGVALQERLALDGFTPGESLQWLAAATSDLALDSDVSDAVTVRVLDSAGVPGHASPGAEFLALLQRADGPIDPKIRALRAKHYATGRFPAYVASMDGDEVGWATLFLHDGIAWLGNAWVAPAFRRRGAHRALTSARIRWAQDRGIEHLISDVSPGSASHRNLSEFGFVETRRQTWWARMHSPDT